MSLTEPAVPVKKGRWPAGSEEHEVSFKAFLVDDGSGFERSEDGALGLRETKAGFDERIVHERGIDRPLVGQRLERRQRDVAAIDFEETAQSTAEIAATEPVRSQHSV